MNKFDYLAIMIILSQRYVFYWKNWLGSFHTNNFV